MDKAKLIDMLRGLGLDPEVEDALVAHVEAREMSDELLESVATALDLQAKGADIVRDQLLAESEILEDLATELKAKGEEYGDGMKEILDGYLTKVGEIGQQAQGGEQPAAAAPVQPMMTTEPVVPVEPIAAAPVNTPEPISPVVPLSEVPSSTQSPFGQDQTPQMPQ